MKKVTFAKATGETKEINVRLSLGYFFFGPLYLLFKGVIVRGIILTLVYAAVIYWDTFGLTKDLLVKMGVEVGGLDFLDKLQTLYWWLLGALAVVHLTLTLIAPRILVRKVLKQGYVPYSEIDTQILIKHNLAKVGTLCYLSSFKAIDGVQGKIKMGNSKDLQKELDELKQLLKDGMITKDEYETKRAQAIMRSGNKK